MPISRSNPQALELDDFSAETMGLITAQPTPDEVLVERVKFLRNAERTASSRRLRR